jgi:hypothetical protein
LKWRQPKSSDSSGISSFLCAQRGSRKSKFAWIGARRFFKFSPWPQRPHARRALADPPRLPLINCQSIATANRNAIWPSGLQSTTPSSFATVPSSAVSCAQARLRQARFGIETIGNRRPQPARENRLLRIFGVLSGRGMPTSRVASGARSKAGAYDSKRHRAMLQEGGIELVTRTFLWETISLDAYRLRTNPKA